MSKWTTFGMGSALAALAMTAHWYRRHRLGAPATDLIAADIESYESGALRS